MSALLAVLSNEPDGERFLTRILAAPARIMSAASLVEAGIVADNWPSGTAGPLLDELIVDLGIEIAPVTETQARAARDAYRTYGKGRHPAGLNFGDCFAYALSKTADQPLLFKGHDFARSDVVAAD